MTDDAGDIDDDDDVDSRDSSQFFFFCKSHILGYDGVYFGRKGMETTQTALFTNILVGEVA